MSRDTQGKLAASLTAKSTELIPHLPYLLQDLWELGSDPNVIIGLLRAHALTHQNFRVLDLACGKGAVSVRVAQAFRIQVRGIDLMSAFIEEARNRAREHRVSTLCDFAVGDVIRAVEHESGYDCVIFGAAGDILGTPVDTLTKLRSCVRTGGFIVIDDAYVSDAASKTDVCYNNYEYLTLQEWDDIFGRCGTVVVERRDAQGSSGSGGTDMDAIRARAHELTMQFPDKRELFDSYVQSQLDEYHDLAHTVVGTTWLLRAV